MGKPIVQAEAEVDKCASACEYYADHAEAFLANQPRETDASESYVRFDALGPVLAVMPWNFPYWQVFRFAAPALMAGNAAILKHASNVPRCALQIEEVCHGAGFPQGLFRAVLLESRAVGALIADPRIAAVTLTGSERAGSQVAERAGREIKKTVLEVGGSDPFIVLADADLPAAAQFLEQFKTELASRRIGDPLARDTQLSPQARVDLREELHRQVEESLKCGAQCLLGGEIPAGKGAFYPPTLLAAEVEAGAVFVNGVVKSDPRLPFGGIKRSGYGRELSEYGIREFVNIKSVWIA